MKTTRVIIVESMTYTYDIEVPNKDEHWFALHEALNRHKDNPYSHEVRGHPAVKVTFEDLP